MRSAAKKTVARRMPNPIARLERFCEVAQELRESRMLHKNFTVGLTVKCSPGQKEAIYVSKGPDRTDLKAFLVTFRKFLSDKEPIHLSTIYNLCDRLIENETYNDNLRQSKLIVNGTLKSTGINVYYHGKPITPKHIWTLLINVDFHEDYEKIIEFKALNHDIKLIYQMIFVDMIIRVTQQIFRVDKIIRAALQEGSVRKTSSNVGARAN